MLETLISSKIRRALFEYLLVHPAERFYLRGLAKELNLSVSPLRRELKRLEHSGLLSTQQEANVLFYTVNSRAPAFGQLLSLKTQGTDVSTFHTTPLTSQVTQTIPLPSFRKSGSVWSRPLTTRKLVSLAGLGMALMALMFVLGLFISRLSLSGQQSVESSRAKVPPHMQVHSSVTEISPSRSSIPASGLMRGTRWQIVPGTMGGFSNSTDKVEAL